MEGVKTQHYAYEAESDAMLRFDLLTPEQRSRELLLMAFHTKRTLDQWETHRWPRIEALLQEDHDKKVKGRTLSGLGITIREWVAVLFGIAAFCFSIAKYIVGMR